MIDFIRHEVQNEIIGSDKFNTETLKRNLKDYLQQVEKEVVEGWEE